MTRPSSGCSTRRPSFWVARSRRSSARSPSTSAPRECVGVSNGTAAIQLALQACGVGAGDEVIVPANTFFATAEAVSTAGATPVFVDCDPVTYNIDAGRLRRSITQRTRAVIPVHLYGQPADLDAVFEVAERHDLLVIEDAAQAHGARYKGRRVGALGRAGCFSFYPGKNLGAYGEGGAVVTNDAEVARRLRMLRDHGSEQKYKHEIVGYNLRLEGIQGAVLNVKLKYLDDWNALRREHAARYRELLAPLAASGALTFPQEADYAEHVYHLFVVQTDARDASPTLPLGGGRADRHPLPRARPPATRLRRARAQGRRLPRRRVASEARALAPDVRGADRAPAQVRRRRPRRLLRRHGGRRRLNPRPRTFIVSGARGGSALTAMTISVGVVGCGYWGPNLIRNFAENEGAVLRWVCDKDARHLSKVARRYPVARASSDYEELLADPRLDAVVIATPVATHYDFARRALEAGKHVLVEKPFTASAREAEELIALAERARPRR